MPKLKAKKATTVAELKALLDTLPPDHEIVIVDDEFADICTGVAVINGSDTEELADDAIYIGPAECAFVGVVADITAGEAGLLASLIQSFGTDQSALLNGLQAEHSTTRAKHILNVFNCNADVRKTVLALAAR